MGDGSKNRCVKKHAFTGPLATACEFTESLGWSGKQPTSGSSTTPTKTFHPVGPVGLPRAEVCPQPSAWKDVLLNGVVDKHSLGSASEPPASCPAPVVEPDHRHSLLQLILRELHYGYPDGCPTPTSSGEFDPYTDSAQAFKAQRMELGPTFDSGLPL
ncbi:hypothetical protein CYMTET_13453 [Cymbomonas tetramitiformis]|uniref:Uncharacterized protein n=1 Tax=Cymbomonas tetramitiformis TaxID=36881 RepID=A0AAE0LB18_9CHLO|nr:hypothetical protein CYMTET_13453 [Cymbomonas tetramitiformis]